MIPHYPKARVWGVHVLSKGDGLGFPCYPKATVWGSHVIRRRRFRVPMLSKGDGLGFPCYPKATVSPKPSPEVIVNIHQFSVKFFKILRLKSSSSPLEVAIPVVGLVQKGHLWYLRKLMFTKATVSLKPSPLTMVPNIEKYYHDPFDLYDPLDWCSEPEVVSPSKYPKDPKIEGILSLDTKGIHS